MPWFKGIIIMHNLFFKLSKAQAPQFLILRIKENTVIGNQFTVSEGSKTEPTLFKQWIICCIIFKVIDCHIPSCKLFQAPWFISRSNYSSTNPRKAEDFSQQKLHRIVGQEIEKMFQIVGFIAELACYANFSFFRLKSIYDIFSAKSAAFEI